MPPAPPGHPKWPRRNKAIRQHWAIEKGFTGCSTWLWVLNMALGDDECLVRSANAPANFTTIKHMAANLPKTARGKESLRLERRLTAWDEDFLHQALKGK